MKKPVLFFIIAIFGLISCKSSNGSGEPSSLLWKISGNGLEVPSYLFGTWHGDTELRNPSFLDSVPHFYEALNSVDVYIGEGIFINKKNTAKDKNLGILMPKDTAYEDILNVEQIARLDSFLIENIGTTSKNMNLRPHALLSIISQILIENKVRSNTIEKIKQLELSNDRDSLFYEKRNRLYGEFDVMDVGLQKYSDKLQKELVGLDELIGFDSSILLGINVKGLHEDADSLMSFIVGLDTIDYVEKTNLFSAGMRKAYREQNATKVFNEKQKQIRELNKIYPKDSLHLKNLMTNVSKERNHKWLPYISDHIHKKSSFIAVGAVHLAGEDGLINLLRKEGYKVEPVK